jgi:hypothetical protein
MGQWWDEHMAPKMPTQDSQFAGVIPIVAGQNAKPPPTKVLVTVGVLVAGLLAYGAYKFTSEMENERKRLTPGRAGVF